MIKLKKRLASALVGFLFGLPTALILWLGFNQIFASSSAILSLGFEWIFGFTAIMMIIGFLAPDKFADFFASIWKLILWIRPF